MAIFFRNNLRIAWIMSRNKKVPHFEDDKIEVKKVKPTNYISCDEMFNWYIESAKSRQTAK